MAVDVRYYFNALDDNLLSPGDYSVGSLVSQMMALAGHRLMGGIVGMIVYLR